MRLSIVLAVGCMAFVSLTSANESQAAMKRSTNIPAQALGSALQSLAKDRKFQIVYVSEELQHLRTQGVVGEFTPQEVLNRLLSGTGLTYKYLDEQTVTIVPTNADAALTLPGSSGVQPSPSLNLAQSEGSVPLQEQNTGAPLKDSSPSEDRVSDKAVEEIIVTAQKREERLQDVPVPVTALGAEPLVEAGLVRIRDYYSRIPSFTVTPGTHSNQTLTIRGIASTQASSQTVAVLVDDVPYGASTVSGGGLIVPDIDPSDLQRIEVLRGPQGTLYGASSMSGLLKFVTVDPSVEELSGRLQVGLSGVENGDELGHNARLGINVPLTSALALRASAFTRQDAGYVDSVRDNRDGINRSETTGGRLAALWKATDTFSVRASALLQKSAGDGGSYATPLAGFGRLAQDVVPGVGAYSRKVQAYSLTLNGEVGVMDWTSVTGYNVNTSDDSYDQSAAAGASANTFFGVTGVRTDVDAGSEKLTQELRANIHFSDDFSLLAGAFYTDESSHFSNRRMAADANTGEVRGELRDVSFPSTYQELAAFANLTWKITDRLDIQVGGRQSWIDQNINQVTSGIVVTGGSIVVPSLDVRSAPFTYLVTPRLRLSPDLMVYARFASGFRAGGQNILTVPNVPLEYDPDTTKNYELGVKAQLFDGALSLDASIYRIDWEKMQIFFIFPAPFAVYTANAGEARSEGVELSLEAHPTDRLAVAGWITYNDARLTQALPIANLALGQYGPAGTQLPMTNEWSANLAITQRFAVTSDANAFVSASASYVGSRAGSFASTPTAVRAYWPSYVQTDLSVGVETGLWTGNLFVNNAFDERAIIGDTQGFPANAYYYIQPRSIGMNIIRRF